MTSHAFDGSRRHLLAAVGCNTLLVACGGGSDDAVVVPAVAPSLTISSSAGALAGAVFTVRFEFSAAVAAFPTGSLAFALQGGRQVAGSFKSLSATVFTVDIEPNTQSSGNVLLTVLSRLGAGSRVVLTHDVAQRDNLRVGRHDGVAAVIEKLKGHPLFGHITLMRSERSPIAALVTEMLEEFSPGALP